MTVNEKQILKNTFIIIIICTITIGFLLYYGKSDARRIKSLTKDLEIITTELATNQTYNSGGEYLNKLRVTFPKLINSLIEVHDLCQIDKYGNKGVVFIFSCKIEMEGISIFEHEPRYNLIKLSNNSKNDELLYYEQFADHGQQPEKLENDWYYIKQNTTFD